jgi:3'(2'), 5'-bisphosphate nucleotidase
MAEPAPPDLAGLLATARVVAREAGRVLVGFAEGTFAVAAKADASPVTDADRASHDLLVARLAALTPGIPVLSEEGDLPAWAEADRFWCVDPLDGTREFVRRTTLYTVNVALVERGRPVLGVVHAPALGRTYTGARGLGATRQDGDGAAVPIHTRPADPRRLTVVASRDHAGAGVEAFIARLLAAGLAVERRPMGSALKFGLLAEGAADLYPRTTPVMWWDTAGPQAVAEAAGARVARLDGRPLVYAGPDLRPPPFVVVGDPGFDVAPFLEG